MVRACAASPLQGCLVGVGLITERKLRHKGAPHGVSPARAGGASPGGYASVVDTYILYIYRNRGGYLLLLTRRPVKRVTTSAATHTPVRAVAAVR